MTADPVRVLPLGGAQKLRVSLAGLPATLSSFHPEFMAYANAHLAPLPAARMPRGGVPALAAPTFATPRFAAPGFGNPGTMASSTRVTSSGST